MTKIAIFGIPTNPVATPLPATTGRVRDDVVIDWNIIASKMGLPMVSNDDVSFVRESYNVFPEGFLEKLLIMYVFDLPEERVRDANTVMTIMVRMSSVLQHHYPPKSINKYVGCVVAKEDPFLIPIEAHQELLQEILTEQQPRQA